MEDTENFHKTCAPANVQAREIHFAVAIGVIQFITQVSVLCYLRKACDGYQQTIAVVNI